MTEVARSRFGVSTHLIPSGSLNEESRITAIRDALDACSAARELQLVLDLADVPLVNGRALETLLDVNDELARVGGSLKAIHANATVQEIFRLTQVNDHIALIDADATKTAPPPGRQQRIGEMLLARGLVSEETIEKAMKLQAETGQRMAKIMVAEGWLRERDLLQVLSDQLGVPFVRLRAGLTDPQAACLIDAEIARRLKVMPLFCVRGVVYLATADPQSIPAIDTVADLTGCRVSPVLACSDEILTTIHEATHERADLAEYVGDLEDDLELVEGRVEADDAAIDDLAGASPVINLINGVIQRAIRDRASDVHIEPGRTRCRIRLRVDGSLYPFMSPPMEIHPALVSRLKVMAKLDIAERRLPQDGRIQVVSGGHTVDLRFSSLPGIFGEKVVLRILDKNESILEVDRLGMTQQNGALFKKLMARSYGLLLVTGPTGSGKTTTLYAALNHLNTDACNIVTIEDPVEYQIDSITQNQVKESIDLTFAKFLKHVLRQDPDIIMVGEIREPETAAIAVQAALTGHLVLSTLHTNDGIGAVTRMIDMGVEPFLLSSALIGVMAQRLVRTVCPDCKTTYAPPPGALEPYGVRASKKLRLARGRGCASCYDSGYKGRIAIHEILDSSPELQKLIVSNPSRGDLETYLRERGIETLLDDGIERVLGGRTSIEEVLRAVNC